MQFFNNPEMRRNLWLEFNKRRLIAMPLGIVAIFLVAYLRNNNKINADIAWVGIAVYAILTFLWGTRQASESIIREVNLGTWSQQKMSSIGPWKMLLGKLFGSTAFIWYGNVFCFLFLGYTVKGHLDTNKIWYYLGLMIAFGFLAHAVTMLASLYSMKYRNSFEKFEILFYQFLGMLVALPMLWSGLWGGKYGIKGFGEKILDNGNVVWYGELYPVAPFVLIILLLAIFWVMLGLYLLMRAEFLIDNSPIYWFLFSIFTIFIISGLDKSSQAYSYAYRFPVVPGYAIAFNVILGMMYVVSCGESKDALRLHLLKYYISSKQWKRFLAIVPRTLVTLPVVVFAAINVVLNVRLPFEGANGLALMNVIPYCVFAAVFFMIRDISIIYLFSIKNKGKNSDTLTPILVILGSYTLLPAFFVSKDLDLFAAFFFPWPQEGNLIMTVIPVAVQAMVMVTLLLRECSLKKEEW